MWEQRHISEVSIVTLCTYFPTAQYNETKFHLLIFKQEVLLAAVSFFNSLNEEGNRSALEIFKSKQEVFKFAVNRCSTKNYFCLCVSPSYKQGQENFDASQALWLLEWTVLILSSLNSCFSTCIYHRSICTNTWVNCILLMFPPQIRQTALFPNYFLTARTIFPGINQEARHKNAILTAFFWMWKLVPAKTSR